MTVEQALTCVSYPASADLSAKQFFCVNLASDGEVQVATGGAKVTGILQDNPAAVGRAAAVAIAGIPKVAAQALAGESIAVGDILIASSIGKAIKGTTGGTAFVFGRAAEALTTAVSAAIISCQLTFEGPASSA
jgi:hypothetical protein